jgi:hypothetical protein
MVTSGGGILLYLFTKVIDRPRAIASTPMTATLQFLTRITNAVFESHMQRVAREICERQQYFGRVA